MRPGKQWIRNEPTIYDCVISEYAMIESLSLSIRDVLCHLVSRYRKNETHIRIECTRYQNRNVLFAMKKNKKTCNRKFNILKDIVFIIILLYFSFSFLSNYINVVKIFHEKGRCIDFVNVITIID